MAASAPGPSPSERIPVWGVWDGCRVSLSGWRCAYVEQFLQVQGLSHGLLTVVEGGVPGVEQEHQPELPRGIALESLLDGDEVLE